MNDLKERLNTKIQNIGEVARPIATGANYLALKNKSLNTEPCKCQ